MSTDRTAARGATRGGGTDEHRSVLPWVARRGIALLEGWRIEGLDSREALDLAAEVFRLAAEAVIDQRGSLA